MAKRYSLLVFIRHRTAPFLFPVERDDYDRLSGILDTISGSSNTSFFWCDTTDGRSVVINLIAVQAVRFLWDGSHVLRAPEAYADPVQLYLSGRNEPIHADVDSAESIYDFFSQLELNPMMPPFPSFVDSDGEYLYANSSEIDLVIAPKDLMDEGARIVQEELGKTPE